MATSSFTKTFVVSDPKAIKQLKDDLRRKNKVVIRKKNLLIDDKKGIELFKQAFSS